MGEGGQEKGIHSGHGSHGTSEIEHKSLRFFAPVLIYRPSHRFCLPQKYINILKALLAPVFVIVAIPDGGLG